MWLEIKDHKKIKIRNPKDIRLQIGNENKIDDGCFLKEWILFARALIGAHLWCRTYFFTNR